MIGNNYVDDAQKIVQKKLKRYDGKLQVTTTQIRKILSAVITLTNKIDRYKVHNPHATTLSDDLAAEVKYLKVLVSYQAGRDDRKPYAVKDFVKQTELIDKIDGIGSSIAEYQKFNKFIEAIVAFHRYEGGR